MSEWILNGPFIHCVCFSGERIDPDTDDNGIGKQAAWFHWDGGTASDLKRDKKIKKKKRTKHEYFKDASLHLLKDSKWINSPSTVGWGQVARH